MHIPLLAGFLAEVSTTFGDLGLIGLGAGIGSGLIVMGAAKGIGHLAGNAVESMARQPEVKGNVFTSMIIAAALIEGFTFFALVVTLLATLNVGTVLTK